MTATVQSKDGTSIAYEHTGTGPALILVDGAMCYRGMGPMEAIAAALAPRFTVYRYDRRGRGESGQLGACSPEREVEDLAAVIAAAGGSAHAFGISSGAMLALEAARHPIGISKLALFEPPLIVDGAREPLAPDYVATMEAHLANGRNGAAVKQFLAFVGMPAPLRWLMPLLPPWRKMVAIAPTLPQDLRLVAGFQTGQPLPAGRWPEAVMPTLVLDGGKSPAWMHHGARALAEALPNARYQTLPGQTHMVRAEALAPELVSFFEA